MWKIIVELEVEKGEHVHFCTIDYRCDMDLSEIDTKYQPPTWFPRHCEMKSIDWSDFADEFEGTDPLEVYFRNDLSCTWTVTEQKEIL